MSRARKAQNRGVFPELMLNHGRTAPVNSGQLRRIIDFPRKPFDEDVVAVKKLARGTNLEKKARNLG